MPSERQVDAELDPIKRAHAAGAQNSPPTSQRALSSDEDAIVLFFKKWMLAIEERVFAALATLRNNLERERALVAVPSVDRAFSDLDSEFRKLKLEAEGRLLDLNSARLKSWRNLRNFRATNRLNRDAFYPKSHKFDMMLLLVLVIIETIGNAFFYRAGNESGYVGGIETAIMISVVNVFVAFFVVGYLSFRHLHARQAPLKLAAIIGATVGCAGIVILNLSAAHFRDMLSAGGDQEVFHAVADTFSKGFDLDTLQAFALLLFGLALAVLAAYKGYYFDDPIPGYGYADRRHCEAKSNQREEELHFRKDLTQVAREHADAVKKEIETLRNSLRDWQTAISLYDLIRDYLPDCQRNVVQRSCDATLRRYREENTRVRTSDVPAAFREYPTIYVAVEAPELPRSLRDLHSHIATLNEADAAFAHLQNEFIQKVEEFFEGVENSMRTIEEMARSRLDRREPGEHAPDHQDP